MSNLKKVIALSLALVMCFALMSTGLAEVGTDYKNYTDVGDIIYVDAVSLLSALDIIKGMPGGAFDPKGDVTRGQLCKMIYVILNNGNDDGAALYKDANDVPLRDITGHWAEGYIKYCFKKGIVAGMGDGTFMPDDKVTGLQAFKMMLVALGYDALKEGYVGSGWKTNVAMDAQGSALTDKIETVDVLIPISREVSAQIIYNGMFATMVHYVDGMLTKRLGDDSFTPLTFAWDKLGLKILDGVLIANDQVSVGEKDTKGTYHGIADKGYSTIKYKAFSEVSGNVGSIGGAVSSAYVDAYIDIKVSSPYTLVGKAVNAYVKVKPGVRTVSYNWVSGIEKVYGNIVEIPNKNVVTIATNDDYSKDNLTANTRFYVNYADGSQVNSTDAPLFKTNFNADGTPLLAKRTAFDAYYVNDARVDEPAAAKGQTVLLISNDGNKNIEYVLGFDKRFGEITTLSNDRLTLTKNDSANYKQGFYSVKLEDIHNIANFKQGDRALMWKIYEDGTYLMEEPKSVTGTLTGSTGASNDVQAVVNGEKLKIARDHISYSDVIANQFVNKEITYYLDNNYIVGVDEKGIVKAPDKYLVVRGSAATKSAIDINPMTYTASVLTSDGSKKTWDINTIYDRNGVKYSETALKNVNVDGQSVKYPLPGVGDGKPSIDGQVFRYTMTSDGKLVLYVPDAAGMDLKAAYEKGSARLSLESQGTSFTKILDSKTVAFIKNEAGEWYAFTGYTNFPTMRTSADLTKANNDVKVPNGVSVIYGKFSTANDKLNAFAVQKSGWQGKSSGEKYGLIISSLATINTDNTWFYKELVMFNGTDVQTYQVKEDVRVDSDEFGEGALANAGNGRIVKYTFSGNLIDSLEFVDLSPVSPDADTSAFDAGYIYRSSGRTFTMADYLPSSGNPAGANSYALKDDAKIFFYDGTVEGSTLITEIPAQNVPAINFDDRLRYTYQAVVEKDDLSGLGKTLYIFKEEQKLDLTDSGSLLVLLPNSGVVEAQPITVGAAGTFNIALENDFLGSGATITWSDPQISGLTGVTLAAAPNPVVANGKTTYKFNLAANAPASRDGKVTFTATAKNSVGQVIFTKQFVTPVMLGSADQLAAQTDVGDALAADFPTATATVTQAAATITAGYSIPTTVFPVTNAANGVTYTYTIQDTGTIADNQITAAVTGGNTVTLGETAAGGIVADASGKTFTVRVTATKGSMTQTKDIVVTVKVS